MATLKLEGFDEFQRSLENLGVHTRDVCDAVVYAGAKVAADEVKKSVDGLQRVSDADALNAYRKGVPTYLSVSQKNGLRASLGIAPFRRSEGTTDTSIGFDGYNDIKTKRYPKGEPNAMIARTVNSGSTYMIKQPFVRNAVSRAREKAKKAMAEVARKTIDEVMK